MTNLCALKAGGRRKVSDFVFLCCLVVLALLALLILRNTGMAFTVLTD